MKTAFFLVLIAFATAFAWLVWYNTRNWKARRRAEQERFANFMAGADGSANRKDPQALPAPAAATPPPEGGGLAQQKLLFEAAHKAAEAGEPALAIQLYARLLARYPASAFAGQARAAAEAQKKNLVKA